MDFINFVVVELHKHEQKRNETKKKIEEPQKDQKANATCEIRKVTARVMTTLLIL